MKIRTSVALTMSISWIALVSAAESERRQSAESAASIAPATSKERLVDPELPDALPVPLMQVIPLPDEKASFRCEGRELTCAHFGPLLRRPYLFPIVGPEGHTLTRMGHPRDPHSHSHHNSVWIAHQDVDGVDFWSDREPTTGKLGRIVHQKIEELDDGDKKAWLTSWNHWVDPEGNTILVERRRITVFAPTDDQWLAIIDLRFDSPREMPVEIRRNPFGMIGVRMAKTIGVRDGGGRILNSEGRRNESEVFRRPAKWCDYSGPITNRLAAGITLFDHPDNPNHPAPFHVRNDGWMGACLTLDRSISVSREQPLVLRYGLWIHRGAPGVDILEAKWREFASLDRPEAKN